MSSRNRWARRALAVLVLAWVTIAVLAPWRAVVNVDDKTYVEMAAGVRDHGLPYTTNTWSDRMPEAHPSWQIPQDGKLWGQYPPAYPYVLAPALALRGLRGVYMLGALLMAALAIALARLGKATFGDELAGTLAAYLASIALPVVVGATQTISMPLALLCCTGAMLAGVYAVREGKTRFYAAAGALAGLAIATHLLETGMTGAICAALVVAGRRDLRSVARRFAAVSVPFVAALAPVVALNRVRFGDYNPLTYGPCVWRVCSDVLENSMTARLLIRWALPGIVPLGAAACGVFVLRRRRDAALGWAVACALVAASIPSSRKTVFAMARTVWGYFVDSSLLDLSQTTFRMGSLGWVNGPHIIRGLLECSPWIVVAVFGVKRLARRPKALAVLGLPLVALALQLAMFGWLKTFFALGWPYLLPRYALYATPVFAVFGGAYLARLPVRREHAVFGVVLAVALLAWFIPVSSDESWWRRLFLLRLTLLLALVVLLTAAVARRWPRPRAIQVATFAAVAAVASGVGTSVGIDWAMTYRQLDGFTEKMERLESLAPQRFALVGWGPETDPILVVRAERDVHYFDLIEAKDWDNFRRIIDKWTDDGRPIYGAFPVTPGHPFVWPLPDWDVPAVRLDAERELWKIGPPRRRFDDPVPPQ